MSVEFPTMLYKDRGPYQRRGGTFSIVVVNTQEEYDSGIGAGLATHPDFIDQASPAAPEPVVDAGAPTRAEMETKATELGLKFDGRTSDRKLLAMIETALANQQGPEE